MKYLREKVRCFEDCERSNDVLARLRFLLKCKCKECGIKLGSSDSMKKHLKALIVRVLMFSFEMQGMWNEIEIELFHEETLIVRILMFSFEMQ